MSGLFSAAFKPAPVEVPPPSDGARRGGLVVFLVVAFAVTWSIWLPLLIQAQTSEMGIMPSSFFVASLGPGCGAIAASLWSGGFGQLAAWARRTFALGFAPVWWAFAIGMPIAYLAIGWIAAFLVTGAWPDLAEFGLTEKLPGLAWPAVAMVWVLTFGLGEEAGWRGWLLPQLSRRLSVFWASLIVAGVWIAWHLPAFFFNPTYIEMGPGIIGWMLALISGSFLLAWMTAGARWSIVPVLLWHAGFDLLTAADVSAGVVASAISAVVMIQGVGCAWLLWRRRR